MIRKIIKIDEDKCFGCGLCANACHESAIVIRRGKAKLIRDDYCDGMGDCLPKCPTGAISFEEREALPYDEAAVKANMAAKEAGLDAPVSVGCPGAQVREMKPTTSVSQALNIPSQLKNWPPQIKLAPIKAPYFDNADLLIAADCTAYSYADFHNKFMAGTVTLIACPKLDNIDYSEKLTDIFMNNKIKSVKLVRMEVPCCGGLQMAIEKAIKESGKELKFETVVVNIDGSLR